MPPEKEECFMKKFAAMLLALCLLFVGTCCAEEASVDHSAIRAAYLEAMRDMLDEQIFPDGSTFDESFGKIEENSFAVYDVDLDGKEELIVRFTAAPTAGQIETVYSYDAETDMLNAELYMYPAVTYLDNGMIKEGWSHGSGLAEEGYWPYNLYQYNAETGVYDLIAEVDMWSKPVETVNYAGETYPDDVDAENAGTVFIVTYDGKTETISKSAYEAWLGTVLGDAAEAEITFLPITDENVSAICA